MKSDSVLLIEKILCEAESAFLFKLMFVFVLTVAFLVAPPATIARFPKQFQLCERSNYFGCHFDFDDYFDFHDHCYYNHCRSYWNDFDCSCFDSQNFDDCFFMKHYLNDYLFDHCCHFGVRYHDQKYFHFYCHDCLENFFVTELQCVPVSNY